MCNLDLIAMCSLDVDELCCWLSLDDLTAICSLDIDRLGYWLSLDDLAVMYSLDIDELRLFDWLFVDTGLLVLNVFWCDCHGLFRMDGGVTISFTYGVVYLAGTVSYEITTCCVSIGDH